MVAGCELSSRRTFQCGPTISLMVEVSQIVVHEADEPNVIAHLFDPHVFTGEDQAEVDFVPVENGCARMRLRFCREKGTRALAVPDRCVLIAHNVQADTACSMPGTGARSCGIQRSYRTSLAVAGSSWLRVWWSPTSVSDACAHGCRFSSTRFRAALPRIALASASARLTISSHSVSYDRLFRMTESRF
jgi:hypothetical protein